ncbi:unnamed protein product [Microthlaspi erraticum]|uniref:Reverse transcriptase zinc-binding domain-containing protein n=1 Tax=Microthlaspi erraticum TaxID=1685480 RepID=A0A6D2KG96_9BRAS|nr:unnamed protein product [Microthlaspi erraticum]
MQMPSVNRKVNKDYPSALARPYMACQVRSGSTVLLWHDDWTGLGPLIDISGANGPRVCGIRSMAIVSQGIQIGFGRFVLGDIRSLFYFANVCLRLSLMSLLCNRIFTFGGTALRPFSLPPRPGFLFTRRLQHFHGPKWFGPNAEFQNMLLSYG